LGHDLYASFMGGLMDTFMDTFMGMVSYWDEH
jgi:hypothetical protein